MSENIALAAAQSAAASASSAATSAEHAASIIAEPNDAAVSTLVNTPASDTAAALAATYGTGVSVMSKGAVADGVADDAPAFEAALTTAATLGADVLVPAGVYRFASTVTARSGVTIRGVGNARIKATTAVAAAFGSGASAISDFTLDGLTIEGGVVEEGVYPRRGRTGGSSGFTSALAMTGDAYTAEGGTHPLVENITVRNCRLLNLSGLPVFLRGVRGHAAVTDNHISNCLDTGFVYCEAVLFANNRVEKSADNGVSVSRQCAKVVVADNVIRDSAYYGIWVAGYVGETVSTYGPDTFAVTGNVVTNSGHGGIALRDAPRYGTVAGNTVDGTMFGPTDEPSSTFGTGLAITGWPSTPLGAPTRTAAGINVTGNVFRNCVRNGVGIRGSEDVRISDNLFIDVGAAVDVDAVAISSTSTAANCGIAASEGTSANMTRIVVVDNTFVDTRATAVSNYAITADIAASSGFVGEGNKVFRYRQAHIEHSTVPNSGYFRALTAAGTARKLWGLTSGDNMRTVLPGSGKQWEGYNDTEASLLWRITGSGRADFSVGSATLKYTSGASAPGFTTNGHVEVWHDTGSGTSYMCVHANGVVKKVAVA